MFGKCLGNDWGNDCAMFGFRGGILGRKGNDWEMFGKCLGLEEESWEGRELFGKYRGTL